MPCYDGREQEKLEEKQRLEREAELYSLREEAIAVRSRSSEFEAALCALTNWLERKGDLEEAMLGASKDGEINILDIVAKHRKLDFDRLKEKLYGSFSKDEIDIIKKILSEGLT